MLEVFRCCVGGGDGEGGGPRLKVPLKVTHAYGSLVAGTFHGSIASPNFGEPLLPATPCVCVCGGCTRR